MFPKLIAFVFTATLKTYPPLVRKQVPGLFKSTLITRS